MNKLQALEKARQKRIGILLFESKSYSITKIPHNYLIYIKLDRKKEHQTINRDFYCPIEDTIFYAHEIAKDAINKYFKS